MGWKRILSQKRPAAGGEACERASFLCCRKAYSVIEKTLFGEVRRRAFREVGEK